MATTNPVDAYPLRRVQRLIGHTRRVYRLAWTSDERHLLSSSEDETIRTWDVATGKEARRKASSSSFRYLAWSPDGRVVATDTPLSGKDIRLRNLENSVIIGDDTSHKDKVTCLAWSPKGNMLATGSDDYTAHIINLRTRRPQILDHNDGVTCMVWSPDGRFLATGTKGMDNTVRIWEANSGKLRVTFKGHTSRITCLAWSPDGETLASGSMDRTIRLWDLRKVDEIRRLEGHTATLTSLSFSPDSQLLISKAQDETLRFWSRPKRWNLVMIQREEGADYSPSDVVFHPSANIFATMGDNGRTIDVWSVNLDLMHESKPNLPIVYYSNAKVMLAGDGSVGKTCLARAIVDLEFTPPEGTHGINTWVLEADDGIRGGQGIKREVVIWDMAGQDNYRDVHHLYLKDISLALLIFYNGSPEPLRSIRYWLRALGRVQNQGKHANVRKLLVEARSDQGGRKFSQSYLDNLVERYEFEGFHRTSALENTGIDDLRDAILDLIDWDDLPEVVSTEFFETIRDFLKERQEEGSIKLESIHNLFNDFLESGIELNLEYEINLRQQFETCIGFLESMGLMRRFKYGGLVLLQPELLNAYASSIIDAARNEMIDGFGRLSEQTVWDAQFPIHSTWRLQDEQQERWLLLATIDDLLSHEVVLRDDGVLIFPSQFLEIINYDLEIPELPEIVFHFEGPVTNLYAIIAVRLARSEEFELEDIGPNCAVYRDNLGNICAISLEEHEDGGSGEIYLYFDADTTQLMRYMFELFIHEYLKKQAQAGSLRRRRQYICSECETGITEEQVQNRLNRGFTMLRCPSCDHMMSLTDPAITPEMRQSLQDGLRRMTRTADMARQHETAEAMLKGKKAMGTYDVFIYYNYKNHDDELVISALKKALESRGIHTWDKEPVQINDIAERLSGRVTSIAICVGSQGTGQATPDEIQKMIKQCNQVGMSVIIVMMHNAKEVPAKLLMMKKGITWVYFFQSPNDPSGLDDLELAITGKSIT